MAGGGGGIILTTTVANTRGLSGLVSPRYCWNYTTKLHDGERAREPRSNMLWLGRAMGLCHQLLQGEGPEGGHILCDSVTKVFHEANIKEYSSWPSGLGLVGEALPQEVKQPCHPPPSPPSPPMSMCLCVCSLICVSVAVLLGGAKEQLFKRPLLFLFLAK